MEQEDSIIDVSQMPGSQIMMNKLCKTSLNLVHSPPSPPSSQPPNKKMQHCAQLKRGNDKNNRCETPLLGDDDSGQSTCNRSDSLLTEMKRRRCAASPVRPWKSPSPAQSHRTDSSINSLASNRSIGSIISSLASGPAATNTITTPLTSSHSTPNFISPSHHQTHGAPQHLGDAHSPPASNTIPVTASNLYDPHACNTQLLRHISVIRDGSPVTSAATTAAVLRPQANYPLTAAAAQATSSVYSCAAAAAAAAAANATTAPSLHQLNNAAVAAAAAAAASVPLSGNGYQLALQQQLAVHQHVTSQHPGVHNQASTGHSPVHHVPIAPPGSHRSPLNQSGPMCNTHPAVSNVTGQHPVAPYHQSTPHSAAAAAAAHSMHTLQHMHAAAVHGTEAVAPTAAALTPSNGPAVAFNQLNQLNQLHLVDPYSAYTPGAAAAAAAAAALHHHHWAAY